MTAGDELTIGFFVLAAVFVVVYNRRTARNMVQQWLLDNGQYRCHWEDIAFPPFGDRSEARLTAVDADGNRVLIVLRLRRKYVRSFLERAVCESVRGLD
jgi:hypothetical protein